MSRALEEILKFSAEEMGLVRVQATIIQSNERSAKLLKRFNFECEGLLKKYECLRGDFYDSNMYAKILHT
jgi:ribosomal-protein-alanine N-acetyltransferase